MIEFANNLKLPQHSLELQVLLHIGSVINTALNREKKRKKIFMLVSSFFFFFPLLDLVNGHGLNH